MPSARFTIRFLTSAGLKLVLLERMPAAIPATSEEGKKLGEYHPIRSESILLMGNNSTNKDLRGLAMLVPLIDLVAVFEFIHADVMLEPGANMSTQLP